MTVRPTVMPAIMSETSHSMEYLGSHVRIGIRLFTFSKTKIDYTTLPIYILFSSPAFQFCPQLALVGQGLEGESEKYRKQNLSLSSSIECSALTSASETDSHEVKVKVFSFILR